MFILIRFPILFLILFFLSGCVPSVTQFIYISLADAPDIEIVERGRFTGDKSFFHEEMPVKYKLSRDTYDVFFLLDQLVAGQVMFVWAVSSQGQNLDIKKIDVPGSCGGFRSFTSRKINSSQISAYVWGIQTKNCVLEDGRYKLDVEQKYRHISFKIFDQETFVAQESIPFNWANNGYYVQYDSL